MGEYNRERSGGGRSGGGFGGGNRGGRDSGRREGGRPEMFRTTCDECGNGCEVPFKPSGDKPVYCSDCFRNIDSARNERDSGRREYSRDRDDRGRRDSRDDFGEKRMFKATCSDCGNDCELPFKPTSDRPVFCSDCFITDDKSKSKKTDESKLEFEKLNAKLDMIINFLGISEVKKEKVKIKLLKNAEVDESEENFLEEETEEKAPVKKTIKKVAKK